MGNVHFKDHLHIEFPAWLRKLGLNDYSYKHDACARAVVDVCFGSTLEVWVAEKNPLHRESVCEDEYAPRFSIYLYGGEDGDSTYAVLYSGDDWREARDAIRSRVHSVFATYGEALANPRDRAAVPGAPVDTQSL